MEQPDKEVLDQLAIKTILQEGVDFTVTRKNPNLIHKALKDTKRKFVMYPLVMGAILRISAIWSTFNQDDIDKGWTYITLFKQPRKRIDFIYYAQTATEQPKSLLKLTDYSVIPNAPKYILEKHKPRTICPSDHRGIDAHFTLLSRET